MKSTAGQVLNMNTQKVMNESQILHSEFSLKVLNNMSQQGW
jgi:hypothetical protein